MQQQHSIKAKRLWCMRAGVLRLTTEFGIMDVAPGEVCVVQCGMRFCVGLLDGCARGYILEVFGSHFALPDLGPVGERCTDPDLRAFQLCCGLSCGTGQEGIGACDVLGRTES
jgi:homogentisate 1,2-dioxygenase